MNMRAGQTATHLSMLLPPRLTDQQPLTGWMRSTSFFRRGIALLVLITFLSLTLSPTVVAIENTTNTTTPAPQSEQAKLSKAILNTQRKLDHIADKLNANQDATTELTELQTLKDEINVLNTTVQAEFDATHSLLQSKALPQVILDRHTAAVAEYQAQLATLLQNLNDIDSATDNEQRKTKVNNAKAHLNSKQLKRAHQESNPNDLSNKAIKAKPNNKAKETQVEFTQAGLYSTPFPKLAALGDFTFDQLAGASDPAYLAATPEVTLTQAIQDHAASLNHDPVQIYHWVRNNVEWMPSWGGVQDADLTLGALRGNSLDIAGLTIALLRASGIPARYVHGTIEVPKDQFINWTGDFATVEAAQEFASVGGIPTTSVSSGGVITKMRLEHVWVEAAIDFQPSRGAKNFAADSWVQLDPSYKQYTYQQGLDAVAISGINPEQLAQDFTNSGTINETEGWVSGFDATILETAQTQAQTALEDYITNQMTDPTVGDVIGGKKTIIQEYSVLPSALPNKVITTGARYAELPNGLRYQMSFAFGKDVLGELINPITYPLAQVNNHKVTLSFTPATADDEAALEALLPEGEITDISQLPSSIPAYLINVIPEIKLNGVTVKQGSPMNLGYDLPLTYQLKTPLETHAPYTYKVPAGSYLSLAAIGQNVSADKLSALQTQLTDTKEKLESEDPALIETVTREALLGDIFYTGSMGYFTQYIALSHIAAISQQNTHNLSMGYGSFGFEPNVSYLFGVPATIEAGGIVVDVRIGRFIGTHHNDIEVRKELNRQVGILSSALEHAVPEQMFTVDPLNPVEGVSTAKALSKAIVEGQRIYHITSANQATALPKINHAPETMTEITNALAVGKEIITHADSVSVPGWSGAGYVILDPTTGDAGYKISGGGNGGWNFIDGGSALIQVGLVGLFAISQGLIVSFLPFIALSIGIHFLLLGYILLLNDAQANFTVGDVLSSVIDTLATGPAKSGKAILDVLKFIVDSIVDFYTRL